MSGMNAPSSSPVASPAARGARPGRNAGIDFTKGALVVSMVVYHSINYLSATKDWLRYMHFVPGSFIFITGFLITYVYRNRASAGASQVQSRLVARGLKLAAIFIGLNVFAHAFVKANYNQASLGLEVFWYNLDSVLLSGNQRIAVFEVLLPISYLLLVGGALLRVEQSFSRAIPIAAAAGLLACVVAETQGQLPLNADLLSIGLAGMLAGLVPIARIDTVVRSLAVVALAYAAYVAVVAFRYPTYLMNLAGVPLTLVFLYALGKRTSTASFVGQWMALLGRYSLFSYIAQIAILQVIFRLLRNADLGAALLPVGFCITLAATSLIALLLERSRTRFRVISTAYDAAFA